MHQLRMFARHSLAEFASADAKKVKHFSQGHSAREKRVCYNMCLVKNTSRKATVRAKRVREAARKSFQIDAGIDLKLSVCIGGRDHGDAVQVGIVDAPAGGAPPFVAGVEVIGPVR